MFGPICRPRVRPMFHMRTHLRYAYPYQCGCMRNPKSAKKQKKEAPNMFVFQLSAFQFLSQRLQKISRHKDGWATPVGSTGRTAFTRLAFEVNYPEEDEEATPKVVPCPDHDGRPVPGGRPSCDGKVFCSRRCCVSCWDFFLPLGCDAGFLRCSVSLAKEKLALFSPA